MPVALDLIPSEPHQEFSTNLEGSQYNFECRWNARAASWYLSIYTEQGDLLGNARLVVGPTPLYLRSGDERLPPGALFTVDTQQSGRDATLDDLGTRVQVWYFELSEFPAG